MEKLKPLGVILAKLGAQANLLHKDEIALANERWDSAPKRSRILANIALDFLLIAIAAVTASLFCVAFQWVMQASETSRTSSAIPIVVFQEIAVLTVISGFVLFTFQDLISLFNRRLKMPFEFSLNKASSIYWNRTRIYFLAASFNAILLRLYISFPLMDLASGVFLAAVFSLAILAIEKSAPIPKVGFFLSLFFFVVVIVTIPIVDATYSPVNTSSEETELFLDD